MNKKKILWINSKADFTGGCESYIFHTASFLNEQGYENFILYDVEGWTDPAFLKPFAGAFPLVILSRQIQEIKPDLIYVHRLDGIRQIAELANCQVPVIRFFHDHKLFCLREHKYKTLSHQTCLDPVGFRCYPCLGFINRGSGAFPLKFKSLHRLKAEQAANKLLSGFVVASDYMKNHLIAHGFDPHKIQVIPLYSWKNNQNYQIKDDNYLLYAGQILRGKGLDLLLNAKKIMKMPTRIIIAGSGKQLQEFQTLAQKLDIADQVDFIGFVNQEKLLQLYSNCTSVVMPSRVPETFGLAGLEAMSFGKPVVAADVGGISQWLRHEYNGLLVKSNDALALAEALDKLLNNQDKAHLMGQNGLKMYKELFNPQKHIEALKNFFSLILQEDK